MVTYSANPKGINILFSKSRQAILSLLYSNAAKSYYLRQIVRTTGIGLGPAQQELKQLADAGIINRFQIGNQVHYQANSKLPVYKELKNILAHITHEGKTATVASASGTKLRSDLINNRFKVSRKQLATFCRNHHIKKLSLFGSVLGDDFRPDSDIDVLVEFEKGKTPGFGIIDMETELSQLAGRKVDLRTAGDLSRYFRDQVVREAEVRYEAR